MSTSRPLISAASQPMRTVIDADHLARMTLGDPALEREVLQIFVRQAALLLKRIGGSEPAIAAAAAHTLKGSARGIGAWQVAQAAERLEQAACGRDADAAVRAAAAELEAASFEACAAIGTRLGRSSGDDAAAASAGRVHDH